MDCKGDDSLLKPSRVTEYTLNNGGYVSLLFGGFLLLGCVTAYVIAVARGNVDAFLPLISDAAGSPPQNGLFGTLLCVGGMLGVFCMFLRYMIIEEQNQQVNKLVSTLNKVSLVVGLASMCGITLITGYPVNFYRSKDVWLSDVGIPHMIGGVMLFSLGLIYTAIQCILTLFTTTAKNRSLLYTRIFLCLAATAAFVFHLVTVPDNFGGISVIHPTNLSTISINTTSNPSAATFSSIKLPIEKSETYLSSAITQWILVFLFCFFFFTFFGEAQQYSFLIVIETHSPDPESVNEVSTETKVTLATKDDSATNKKSRPSICSIGGNDHMKDLPNIRSGFPPKVTKKKMIQDNAHFMKKRLSVSTENGFTPKENSEALDDQKQVEKNEMKTTTIDPQEENKHIQKRNILNGTTPRSNGEVISNNTSNQMKEVVTEKERGSERKFSVDDDEVKVMNNTKDEIQTEKEDATDDNDISQTTDIPMTNSNGLLANKTSSDKEQQ